MRTALPILALTAMLATFQARAGELAPAPQFLATYDRSFIERFRCADVRRDAGHRHTPLFLHRRVAHGSSW